MRLFEPILSALTSTVAGLNTLMLPLSTDSSLRYVLRCDSEAVSRFMFAYLPAISLDLTLSAVVMRRLRSEFPEAAVRCVDLGRQNHELVAASQLALMDSWLGMEKLTCVSSNLT